MHPPLRTFRFRTAKTAENEEAMNPRKPINGGEAHTQAYTEADPRAIYIEKALQNQGLSGLISMRPKGLRRVETVSAMYAAYGERSVTDRTPLTAHMLLLGNEIVDWIVDALRRLVERGDRVSDAFSSKTIRFLIRVQRDSARLPLAEELGSALVRCDLRILLNILRMENGKRSSAITWKSAQAALDYLRPLVSKKGNHRSFMTLMAVS